jgi:protein required for attachment to host cells
MPPRTHAIQERVLDWILVANAARARTFRRDPENGAMRHAADYVHPASRLKGSALDTDRPGQARKSGASTAFAPHTDAHEREHERFARELAAVLESAAQAHEAPVLVVIASNPFLGELKSHLGEATRRLLKTTIALDLTAYHGADLERRVTAALRAAV